MRRVMSFLLALALSVSLVACGHEHTWIDATCTEPKTCSVCGETEGDALGHNWTAATCTESKRCTVCGAVDGEPLGHDWIDATCIKPKLCSRCRITDGNALGHVEGKWISVSEPTLSTPGKEDQTCAVCGEVIDSRTVTKEVEYSGGEFNFTRDEFMDYLLDHINTVTYRIVDAEDEKESLGHLYGIYNKDEEKVYAIIGIKENRSGNVTEINVWGEIESLAIAIHVFQTLTGRTVDTGAVITKLDNGRSFVSDGLKLSYITTSDEGLYIFKIVGA